MKTQQAKPCECEECSIQHVADVDINMLPCQQQKSIYVIILCHCLFYFFIKLGIVISSSVAKHSWNVLFKLFGSTHVYTRVTRTVGCVRWLERKRKMADHNNVVDFFLLSTLFTAAITKAYTRKKNLVNLVEVSDIESARETFSENELIAFLVILLTVRQTNKCWLSYNLPPRWR